MTDIVPAPDIPLSSEFPTGADRTAGVFNAKAAAWADTSRNMAAAMDASAKSAQTNATAAKEGAAAAVPAATAAVSAAEAAVPAAAQAAADADWIARRDLGPHPTFPTTDNQGRHIIVGAHFLYTGVTPNAQYAWDGTQWIIGVNVTAGVTQVNGEAGAVILKTIGGESLLGSGNIDASALYRVIRTSDSQLVPGDKSKLIDITAGTFTQTFAAAATLGDGWWCYLRNSGTGDITLDPYGSETVDGISGYVMYPGECRLVQCDGGALRTVVLNAFYREFTASGAYLQPPGYKYIGGLLWSGGAGGSASGEGGGGGGCNPICTRAPTAGSSITVIIGAGGVVDASGGSSNFGSIASVSGAAGSYGGGTVPLAGFGQASPGVASFYGGAGGGSSGGLYSGASSIYGGGGGGKDSYPGGTSVYGGNAATSVLPAAAPGGGGAGAVNKTGARGELRIWGII